MFDAYSLLELLSVAGLGLIAGTLGGMLGVGGGVLIIPGLVLLLGRPTGVEQHLYQAAAMIANVAVSVPAALRHRRAGAMTPEALRWMLPAALVFVLVGVALSNLPVFSGRDGGVWLGRILAVFLLYAVYVNTQRLFRPAPGSGPGSASGNPPRSLPGNTPEMRESQASGMPPEIASETQCLADSHPTTSSRPRQTSPNQTASSPDTSPAPNDADPADPQAHGFVNDLAHVTPARSLAVGTVMGTVAGLLGIGGGAVGVPLQQTLLKLPLRRCIANSSAVICISATLGAIYKNATLASHTPAPGSAPGIASGIAPGNVFENASENTLGAVSPGQLENAAGHALTDAAEAANLAAQTAAQMAGNVVSEIVASLPAAAEPITWVQGLTLGLLLAPTAWVGGRLGAALTHRLPLRAIRVAFITLIAVACWKMAAF